VQERERRLRQGEGYKEFFKRKSEYVGLPNTLGKMEKGVRGDHYWVDLKKGPGEPREGGGKKKGKVTNFGGQGVVASTQHTRGNGEKWDVDGKNEKEGK